MSTHDIAGKKEELDKVFITMGSEENGTAHSKYSDLDLLIHRERSTLSSSINESSPKQIPDDILLELVLAILLSFM